jgi:hypothetical protein
MNGTVELEIEEEFTTLKVRALVLVERKTQFL